MLAADPDFCGCPNDLGLRLLAQQKNGAGGERRLKRRPRSYRMINRCYTLGVYQDAGEPA